MRITKTYLEEIRRSLNYSFPKGVQATKQGKTQSWGELREFLTDVDTNIWGRWQYYSRLNSNITKYSQHAIPRILIGETDYFYKVKKSCWEWINLIPNQGAWDQNSNGWVYFEYFCDWLLWSFGHPYFTEKPKEPFGCEGAASRLGNAAEIMIWMMVANPWDYLGEILHDSQLCKPKAFFRLPDHRKTEADILSTFSDLKANILSAYSEPFPIPLLESGRFMLHLSNYCINICGQEVHPTLLKICQVQAYLYAPWVAEPLMSANNPSKTFFYKNTVDSYQLLFHNIQAFSASYSPNHSKYVPDLDAISQYRPFCKVKEDIDPLRLDSSFLNTGVLWKHQFNRC